MKKTSIKSLIIGFGLLAMTSCGGSSSTSSVKESPVLGKVPGCFAAIAQEENSLKQFMKNQDYSGNPKDRIKTYEKKRAEVEQKTAELTQKAAEEGQKLIGHEVPYSGDVYPDFKVTDIKIESFSTGDRTGTFIVRVMAVPKRDIVVRDTKAKCAEGEYSLKDTRLYYALMKADDHLIELGQLNPFSYNAANSKLVAEYTDGQTVPADVPCQRDGSPIYINMHSYDFSEFAKIVFFTEKDFMAIRKQAYGF